MNQDKDIIFGIHPVLEKLRASPDDVTEVVISNGPARAATHSVNAAARNAGVRVNYASAAVLDRLAPGVRHQGVVAKNRALFLFRSFTVASNAFIINRLRGGFNIGRIDRSA